MSYYNQTNDLMQQIFGRTLSTPMSKPTMSLDQLFSVTSTLDKQAWSQLVSQARAKGISDQDIQAGLNILLQHK